MSAIETARYATVSAVLNLFSKVRKNEVYIGPEAFSGVGYVLPRLRNHTNLDSEGALELEKDV